MPYEAEQVKDKENRLRKNRFRTGTVAVILLTRY